MGRPIRVLHVVVNMNRGGAETLIMNLYRNIDRSKIQFDFLICKEGVFDQEILDLGGKIHRIPYITDGGHFHYIKNLNQFFKTNNDYKIVHSHMDKMSGFVLKAAKKGGIPVRIAHSHSTRSEGKYLKRIYKWYSGRNIVKDSTHLIACSKPAADWLFKKKMNEVNYIKNGVDPEKFGFSLKNRIHVRKELNIPNDCLVIGHVGSFTQPKNHLFLLEIFREFNKKNNNSVLVLVGSGQLRDLIENKIKELNLEDKIKILGIRSDIHRILQAFDVFIFPSLYEGLPVTLIEAQTTGLPCIIADHITKEVDIGAGLISYISIKNSPSEWSNVVLRNKVRNIKSLEALKKSGFDIREVVKWLEVFYIQNGLKKDFFQIKESRNVSNIMLHKSR
ncbi:glycosyltransferase family 1 protein [Metabacillus sp. BG109]|uniref:Glycosyltransferase family 1 protein n=1 Tax=Metabacillus bambusae TaxID=2795218 RepID=A0ABS3N283_9BACI|nr:glycosyltransferase family 1 protein [Metabacillus bambusae]